MSTTQTAELARVRTSISDLVLAFCAERLKTNPRFRMAELTEYVNQFVTVAPDSPRRVFCECANRGEVRYRLLDRRGSAYELLPRYVQREML